MNRYAALPPLPDRLNRLDELATDLWWSWHTDARMVFRRLDYALWRSTAHNPVRMLWAVPHASGSRPPPRDRQLRAPVRPRHRRARRCPRGAATRGGPSRLPQFAGQTIAYFSAEFALHQSLPIYAGGLGVLAGDHCKEASDLGVPLIGVGFMYPQGYFHQHVSAEGWQEESYERLNWADAPIEHGARPPTASRASPRCRSATGRCSSPSGGCGSAACTLYLLDTDLEENAPWDRELSARLYGGDRETRVQQEIILGIGGVRALKALGLRARRLPPERGPRRPSSCCSGSATSSSTAPASTTALDEIRADDGVHDPHAGAGRARRVPVLDGREAPGRLLGHARRRPRAVPGARRVRQRRRRRSST